MWQRLSLFTERQFNQAAGSHAASLCRRSVIPNHARHNAALAAQQQGKTQKQVRLLNL